MPFALAEMMPRPHYQATDYANLTAAWLPHLHYGLQLAPLARSNAYGRWELTDRQILAWLWDWMYERHVRTAKPRYPYYSGMAFADWSAMFSEQMARFGIEELSTIGLGMMIVHGSLCRPGRRNPLSPMNQGSDEKLDKRSS